VNLLSRTKEICRLLTITPSRSKGQNFLVNEIIYDDILEAADVQAGDTVLEVGPGLGFLTAGLAKQAKKVVAVELDDKLAAYLKTGLISQGINNVEIINQDILKFNLVENLPTGYKVVANLPYNITSIFLRQILSSPNKPSSLVLMLQQEVANRIVTQPPDMSVLAVSVQYYTTPKIIRKVSAANFWPQPEVDSAVIRLETKPYRSNPKLDNQFFRLVKIGFSAKRKMLKNNLLAGLKITTSELEKIFITQGFDSKIRAENLSLTDWQKLFAALTKFVV